MRESGVGKLMRRTMRSIPFAVMALGLGMTLSAGQAPSGPPVFTAAQAAAGRGVYMARCAGCHAADMQGRNEASPLAGPNFMNTWRSRTAGDLATYIQSSMPPGGAGTLSPDDYLNVASFILSANSAAAGPTPLSLTTAATIGTVASGTVSQTAINGGNAGDAQATGAARAWTFASTAGW